MTTEQIEKRKDRAENESLIISLNDGGGFRVYSPTYPTKIYTVDKGPSGPTCTCSDYQLHRADPDWQCKHIIAVGNLMNASGTMPAASQTGETKERPDVPAAANLVEKSRASTAGNDQAQMLVRRSVSPDGRIDSLSIEISLPVEIESKEVKSSAEKIVGIISEIVEDFRDENGNNPEQKNGRSQAKDGSLPAQMVNVAGMRGKWGGRRLFINVDVNGQTLKLFGSPKELGQYIVYAGFPDLSDRIAEGATLNLPCRVFTKPSDDGRYTNIARVEPIEALRFTRRAVK